jgi:hypothetical protein
VRGVICRRIRPYGVRRNVHILSRARVMQLLTGFFLNRLRVGLHSLYPLCVELVFLLFEGDPLVQRFIFRPLLFVDNHPVRAQHHVDKEQACERRDRDRRDPPSQRMDSSKNGAQLRHPRRSQSFGPRRSLHHRAQSVLRSGESPYVGKFFYSKIHCLAAPLNFSNSCLLRDSE